MNGTPRRHMGAQLVGTVATPNLRGLCLQRNIAVVYIRAMSTPGLGAVLDLGDNLNVSLTSLTLLQLRKDD